MMPVSRLLCHSEATYQDLIDAIYEHADHVGAFAVPCARAGVCGVHVSSFARPDIVR